jgi:hypothetical protein
MNDEAARATAERGRRFAEWCKGPNGLFEVFAAVERNYTETLYAADIADAALREKVCHRVAALRDVRRVMEIAIAAGGGAEAVLKAAAAVDEKKRARRARAKA